MNVILLRHQHVQRCFTQQLRPPVLSSGAEGSDCALSCLNRNIEDIRGIKESVSWNHGGYINRKEKTLDFMASCDKEDQTWGEERAFSTG